MRRPLVYPVDARIAIKALCIIFSEIARAAINLHHTVNHAPAHFRSKDFEGGGFGENVLASVRALGHICHHRFCGIDFHLTFREHLLDQLEVRNRLAKGLALIGILKRRIERAAGIGSCRCAHRNPAIVEAHHRKAKTLAGLPAKKRVARHFDVLKIYVGDQRAFLTHFLIR